MQIFMLDIFRKTILTGFFVLGASLCAKNAAPVGAYERDLSAQKQSKYFECQTEECFDALSDKAESVNFLESWEDSEHLPDLHLLSEMVRIPDDLGAVIQSPIKGLYQINIGNEIFYLSEDGQYFIEGNLLDLKARKNLTEESRNQLRHRLLENFPEEILEYYLADDSQHEVTIFIDSDCPYCRVVLNNIEAYNARNISLRIAPFSRTTRNMGDHYGLRSIWCAPNRKEALRQEARGQATRVNNCSLDLQTAYLKARDIGVYSVPSFVLGDGTLISGYISPENLARTLNNE